MDPVLLTAMNIIQAIVLSALGLPSLYLFFFALAGIFYRQHPYPESTKYRKIAVMIPAYREDEVIPGTARDAVLQNYPPESYDIVVIADSLKPETLQYLETLPVKVIEVKFDRSTKAKALNSAMQQLGDQYDLAVVLDADNLMAPDFLEKINFFFENEVFAVQGHRTARNLDNQLSILDAVSEEINNHIFRRGHSAVGLSSAIIGSGMAFRYRFFRDLMSGVSAVGGFDKDIELRMLRNGYRIGYLDDAYVFDEKVSKPEVFTTQRRRWLSAQLLYLRRDFLSAVKALFRTGNTDYFDKVIQFALPPRILLLGAMILAGAAFTVMNVIMGDQKIWIIMWLIAAFLCLGTFILSVPNSFYHRRTLRALAGIPHGMLLMMGSLVKIKGANREFLHTEHSRRD